MKVYVDEENRIHDVGSTKDTNLKELTIKDRANPFRDWPVAKICCYKVMVEKGEVTMMTPYVPTSLIEHIEQLGRQNEDTQDEVSNVNMAIDSVFTETVPELTDSSERLTATVDSIITEIIPAIMEQLSK